VTLPLRCTIDVECITGLFSSTLSNIAQYGNTSFVWSVEGHLGYFQFWAIINILSTNDNIQAFM
jgi:hypothetical protein